MRKYGQTQGANLTEVICNCCGRALEVENGYLREECISVEHIFGYFGKKDGSRHQFDLCEECYDRLTEQFRIPVAEEQQNELL